MSVLITLSTYTGVLHLRRRNASGVTDNTQLQCPAKIEARVGFPPKTNSKIAARAWEKIQENGEKMRYGVW